MPNNEAQGDASSPVTLAGRWFAVILLRYNNHDPFWTRDAGLFFQGFKANGVDTRLVLLGDPYPSQDPAMLLASQAQMEDPGWWRQWGLTGVVLYSWALPRYTKIAMAIQQAGIVLVLLVDADGGRRPTAPYLRHFRVKRVYAKMEGRWFPSLVSFAKTVAALPRWRYKATVAHLQCADWVALPSPLGKQRFARYLISCGRPDLVTRLILLHHPVQSYMNYDPAIAKQQTIVAVGSWERLVKGADLLVRVLGACLSRENSYAATIIGTGEARIRGLLGSLPESIQARVTIAGPLPNQELAREFQRAQILVNTSHSESFGIAAAEALCCGCSVVGSAAMSSFNYFCSEACGTLASFRTVGYYCDALLAEVEAWRLGERHPDKISAAWAQRFHADKIARSVLELRHHGSGGDS
jgi:glycosyltransferase involved in cell wall biosynthesis